MKKKVILRRKVLRVPTQITLKTINNDLKIITSPFDPAKFINVNMTFWKGPKDGKGLEGKEERDEASLIFREVDFLKTDFLTCLKNNKEIITGETKLERLKKSGCILYGVTVAAGLWQNYESCPNKTKSVLEYLHQKIEIIYIDFMGDIFRNSYGERCVLYFYRDGNSQWHRHYYQLGDNWGKRHLSAVSQQV